MYNFLYVQFTLLHLYNYYYMQIICTIYVYDNKDIYIYIYNILYGHTFVLRKHHSASHAVITFVERVTKTLDTGKIIVGVFLDLKKAFDTVYHSILLNWSKHTQMVQKLFVVQRTIC